MWGVIISAAKSRATSVADGAKVYKVYRIHQIQGTLGKGANEHAPSGDLRIIMDAGPLVNKVYNMAN